MPKLPESSKFGVTPGKLALIAVLAVVLVVVLAVQLGGVCGAKQSADGDPEREGPKPGPNGRLSARAAQPSREFGSGQDASCSWPKPELADVLGCDPFAAGAPVARPPESLDSTLQGAAGRAEQDKLLEQLQEEGVQAVVGGARNGNVAVIGSKIVRVGDLLGGLRVVGIDADGVVLERSAAE